MPKDEFDLQDPLELNGAVFPTEEDTSGAMCECFIEEFMRLGYGPEQILALFRDPNYLGTNMVLERRGERFVRDAIIETFARWGRTVTWPIAASELAPSATVPSGLATPNPTPS